MLTVEIVENIINSMTPLFRVKTIEDITPTQWKLTTCNTYWLRAFREIEIDGSVYIIDAVTHNENIVISPIDGALKPTITEFSIYSPSFYFGTRNKVNTDRNSDGKLEDEKGFDAITPFAFLLSRISEIDINDDESPIERNANIRIFFLEKYNLEDDTHNKILFDSVIKQLHSMADYFIKTISDDEASFNEPENIDRRQYEAFSPDNTNSEWYFDDSLAGVELNLTLPILKNGCNTCKPPEPEIICAPVIVDINGVNFDTYLTGTQNDILIKDQNGNTLSGVKSGAEYIIEVQGSQPLFYTGTYSSSSSSPTVLNLEIGHNLIRNTVSSSLINNYFQIILPSGAKIDNLTFEVNDPNAGSSGSLNVQSSDFSTNAIDLWGTILAQRGKLATPITSFFPIPSSLPITNNLNCGVSTNFTLNPITWTVIVEVSSI